MLSHSIFSTGQRPQDPERLRAVRGQLQRGQGEVRGAIREGQDRAEVGRLQGQIPESLQVGRHYIFQQVTKD